jgi:hypothetical protein
LQAIGNLKNEEKKRKEKKRKKVLLDNAGDRRGALTAPQLCNSRSFYMYKQYSIRKLNYYHVITIHSCTQ